MLYFYRSEHFLIQIIFIISDISGKKKAFVTSNSTAMKFYAALFKFLLLTTEATSHCMQEQSLTAMALKGHTFKTFVVTAPHLCYLKCEQYPRCRSFNFVIQEQVCEMNYWTQDEKPEIFGRDPERYYVRKLSRDSGKCVCFFLISTIRFGGNDVRRRK